MISGIGLTYGASNKSIHFTLGFPLDFECLGPSLPLFDSISVETFKLYKNSSILVFSSLRHLSHALFSLLPAVSLYLADEQATRSSVTQLAYDLGGSF